MGLLMNHQSWSFDYKSRMLGEATTYTTELSVVSQRTDQYSTTSDRKIFVVGLSIYNSVSDREEKSGGAETVFPFYFDR